MECRFHLCFVEPIKIQKNNSCLRVSITNSVSILHSIWSSIFRAMECWWLFHAFNWRQSYFQLWIYKAVGVLFQGTEYQKSSNDDVPCKSIRICCFCFASDDQFSSGHTTNVRIYYYLKAIIIFIFKTKKSFTKFIRSWQYLFKLNNK